WSWASPISVRVSRYMVVRLAANFATIASTMTRRNGDIAAPSHARWSPAGWSPDRLSCLTGLDTSNLPVSDFEVPCGTHLTIQVVAVTRYQRPSILGLGYYGVHTAASIEDPLVGPLSGILFVTVVG